MSTGGPEARTRACDRRHWGRAVPTHDDNERENVRRSHAETLLSILPDGTGLQARFRVLVIDGDDGAETALRTALSSSDVRIVRASTAARAREILAESHVALIVCDPSVADDPDEFLTRVSDHAVRTGMVLIVLRGPDLDIDDLAIYGRGAEAALTRPVDLETLTTLVGAQLAKLSRVNRRMMQDPVTGQPNMAAFREAFERASYLGAREHEPLSLVMLHLASLRGIRREHGAEVAEAALRRWTEAAVGALRKSDLIGRGSGDWLLILLPNTDAPSARVVVDKLYHRLRRVYLGPPLPSLTEPSLSAGIAETGGRTRFEGVLEDALAALEPVLGEEERLYQKRQPVEEKPAALRILIAEDDRLTASIIQHRLERAGHEVVVVEDGSELLREAPKNPPDLLILDVKIPYVDGFEALKRLRSLRRLRDVPIMMVTSLGDEENISHGFELGADDYLVKPFSPVELQARAERLLRSGATT